MKIDAIALCLVERNGENTWKKFVGMPIHIWNVNRFSYLWYLMNSNNSRQRTTKYAQHRRCTRSRVKPTKIIRFSRINFAFRAHQIKTILFLFIFSVVIKLKFICRGIEQTSFALPKLSGLCSRRIDTKRITTELRTGEKKNNLRNSKVETERKKREKTLVSRSSCHIISIPLVFSVRLYAFAALAREQGRAQTRARTHTHNHRKDENFILEILTNSRFSHFDSSSCENDGKTVVGRHSRYAEFERKCGLSVLYIFYMHEKWVHQKKNEAKKKKTNTLQKNQLKS